MMRVVLYKDQRVEAILILILTVFAGLPDVFLDRILLSLIISGGAAIAESVYEQKSTSIVRADRTQQLSTLMSDIPRNSA